MEKINGDRLYRLFIAVKNVKQFQKAHIYFLTVYMG